MRDEDQRQRRHDPADAAPGRLEDKHQADQPEHDVGAGFDSGPVTERSASRPEVLEGGLRLHDDVRAGRRRREAQHQVQTAQPTVRSQPRVNGKGEKTEQQAAADEHRQRRLRQQDAVVHLEQDEEAQTDAERRDQEAAKPFKARRT